MPSTESEQYLAALCRRSFLSLWSYPNLYTDEGRSNNGQGRELCDLLAVFGNDVLLFSDKHVAYKDTDNVLVDWPRWARRAVASSMKQLYGAESWLRRFPNRVFLSPTCEKQMPVPLPNPDQARFHRIAVTRGSLEACAGYFGNKSTGSLMLCNDQNALGPMPFEVGIGLPGKPFVHVFDEFTLDLLFEHLDTVADFVAYLRKKEEFLQTPGRYMSVAGEEQLLAVYLKKLNAEGEHDFVMPEDAPPEVDHIHLAEGFWEEIKDSKHFIAKQQADRVSYLWDMQIERFIQLGGVRVFGLDIEQGPGDLELALRDMAAEPRVRRRQLANGLLDVRRNSGPTRSYARVVTSNQRPEVAYVLLAEAKPKDESYDDYRKYRISRLAAYCEVTTLRAPNARRIVGLAIDSHDPERKGGSEDLFVLDAASRTPEDIAQAKRLQDEWGILLPENVRQQEYSDSEYPVDLYFPKPADWRETQQRRRERAKAEKRKARMRKASRRRNRQK